MADEMYLEKKVIPLKTDALLPGRFQSGLPAEVDGVRAQMAFPPDTAYLSFREVYPHPINHISGDKTSPSAARVFGCNVVHPPIRFWSDLGHARASQPKRVAAKIFNPLFYPGTAYEKYSKAESEYSAEATAYYLLHSRHKSLLGDCVPAFYGAWSTMMPHPETDKPNTVWILLLEDICGETIGDLIRGRVHRFNSPLRTYFTAFQRERFRLDIMGKALDALAKVQSARIFQGHAVSADKIMVRLVNAKHREIDRGALRVIVFGFSKATFPNVLASSPSDKDRTVHALVESIRLPWMAQFKPWFPAQWTSNNSEANEEAFLMWLSTLPVHNTAYKDKFSSSTKRFAEDAIKGSQVTPSPKTQENEEDAIFADAELIEASDPKAHENKEGSIFADAELIEAGDVDSQELTEWAIIGEDA